MHNLLNEKPFKISIYYMAESASELDEANPANPVVRTGKMSPFCAFLLRFLLCFYVNSRTVSFLTF